MSSPRDEKVPVAKILNAFFVDDFGKIRNKVQRRAAYANAISGRLLRDGYRQIKFEGELFQGSRIAWVLHHKEWPKLRIDFVNGDRDDHRSCNLRVGTNFEVYSNREGIYAKELLKGVTTHKSGRFQAQIRHQGHYIYLGLFDSQDLAHEAYRTAAKRLFGDFYRNTK